MIKFTTDRYYIKLKLKIKPQIEHKVWLLMKQAHEPCFIKFYINCRFDFTKHYALVTTGDKTTNEL